jgi:methylmalonyl-CoA carboxyltransferase 1.3S subunit
MSARGNNPSTRSKKGLEELKLLITIDGHAYEVEVEVLEDDEQPQAPGPLPHQVTSAVAHLQGQNGVWDADGKVCRSPLMGIVAKVVVEPGQAIEAGQLMVVLEAMKMETNVTAQRAAVVKSVHIAAGDSVKMHQVLVELI